MREKPRERTSMGTVRGVLRLLILASGLRIADQAPRRLRSEALAIV